MNSISIHLLFPTIYVHVFLFRMYFKIMYVLGLGRNCNLLMSWHKETFSYHDIDATNMKGGMTHWVNVLMGNGISHICSYFKKRIKHYMATTLYILFLFTKGHVLNLYHEEKSLTWENLEHDMCCLNHIQPTPIILHYFQALKKLIATSRWWDGHLLCYDLKKNGRGNFPHDTFGMEGVKKKESNQLTLSSFEEDNRSVHHSIYGRRIVGEEHDHVTYVLYSNFMCSYTMFLQAMTPRRSVISCEPLGQYWAPKVLNWATPLRRKGRFCKMMGASPKHQTYITLSAMVI